MVDVLKHYSREDVRSEIFRYSRGRWAALEGRFGGGRVFVRYDGSAPLTFSSPADVTVKVRRHLGIGVRTIYVTSSIWSSLRRKEDVENVGNVVKYTPFWDIDLVKGDWRAALEVAAELVKILESEGVERSVYLLWSGEGVHVRLNENGVSEDCLRDLMITPVDAAYAVVEYVLRKYSERLKSAGRRGGGEVKIENLVDLKRVFTAPLSLHRELDRVAVCFKPDYIASFTLDWVKPDSFKHQSCWGIYDDGELDELVRKAVREVGRGGKHGRVETMPTQRAGVSGARRRPALLRRGGGVGRFQVMGLLQAARYYLLYGDLDKAKSFGLNRAIFYAWAKRRGQAVAARRVVGVRRPPKQGGGGSGKLIEVAGEEAFVGPSGYFIMGGQEQRPEDYDRQIASKISAVVPYEKAWEAALKYLSRFPRHVLTDPRKFYEKVYKPVRDNFELVLEGGGGKEGKPAGDGESGGKGHRGGKSGGLLRFVRRKQT